MKLLIASRNRHKVEEIRSLFGVPGLEVLSALDMPGLPEVEEDGDTFEANAVKKASTLARTAGCWALADDSGLEVDALGGAPGVRSARYAGDEANYAKNNAKLLKALEGQPDRRARFRCAVALSSPTGRTQVVEGHCEGALTTEARGERGFGYDPLFVPEGHRQTFAEMKDTAKNAISHRGRALARAREAWHEFLAGQPRAWPEETGNKRPTSGVPGRRGGASV